MNLNLLTKAIFLGSLLVSIISVAQNQNDSLPQQEKTTAFKRHFSANMSGIIPISVGDNFASKGFDFKYGFDINFRGYLNNNVFVGLKFQHLRAEVKEKLLVGFYEYSNINSYFLVAGYRFSLKDKFNIEPYVGYGATVYNNKKQDLNFDDNANSFIMGSSFLYHISKHIKLSLTPEYRIDYTKIKTGRTLEDFFDTANFFNILVGIRFGY